MPWLKWKVRREKEGRQKKEVLDTDVYFSEVIASKLE